MRLAGSVAQSKRIELFERAVLDDRAAALEALRSDLRAAQGPLIERVEGNDQSVLVTFVWFGDDEPMSVRTQLIEGDMSSHVMTRVRDTEVWHLTATARADLLTTYQYVVDDPFLRLDQSPLELLQHPTGFTQVATEAESRSYADPFNPDRLPTDSLLQGEESPPDRWPCVLALPKVEPQPWLDGQPAKNGRLEERLFRSDIFDNERAISVYMPSGYMPDDTPHPLVVLLDGDAYLRIARFDRALDGLIAAGRVPPVVVAFVHNATWLSRFVEMACNPALATMLADELLPMLHSQYNVAAEPHRVVIGGVSYGGLASPYVGFERPDTFGNVLSCSGSHWWGVANDPAATFSYGRDDEPEWLTRQFAAAGRKPLRFWVDVGCLELTRVPQAPGIDRVSATRHFRTVLHAKGYEVAYHEAPGGHEWATFRRSTAKGLEALLANESGQAL